MDIQGISALTQNQASYGNQSQSSATDSSSSGGWKYLTVKEGGRVYTYLVIGKNMKILIGESSEEKTDKKDKQAADGTKEANQETGQAGTTASDGSTGGVGKATNGQKEKQVDFLMNTEMLALTGYYQEQMRRTIKQFADAVGNSSDKVEVVENGQPHSSDHR